MELIGKPLEADKHYAVAGWADVEEFPPSDLGRPIWDMDGNAGIAPT